MKAMITERVDAEPQLVLRSVEDPVPGPDDLLVRIAAAGLNRADLSLASRGHAIHPLGIPGSEMAGEVVAMGAACWGFKLGDRVMALVVGAYAELVCVDRSLAIPIPDEISWQVAASLPAWFMTAHDALTAAGGLRPGEIVLVQGAASGVGIAAIQLARHLGAALVIGVARSAEKLDRLKTIGLEAGIVAESGWPSAVRDATGGKGIDLTIDMVGAGALAAHLEVAALCGRVVAVGRLGGNMDQLDFNMLALKRVKLIGVSFRSRSIEEKSVVARSFENDILPAIAAGRIQPVIDRIYPLAEAAAAQDHLRSSSSFGKTLLVNAA